MAKKAKSPDVFKTISDEQGNLLILKKNDARTILTLKLRTHTKKRRIGVINKARRVFEVRRKRAKHLFRMIQGYGFNHRLLEIAKTFDNIRLTDEHGEWLIPRQFILDNGSFLHFKYNQGFERQIFISLDAIEQFKKEDRV